MFEQSPELLISMALRSDHGFGFLPENQKTEILNQMKELYQYYIDGLNNEEIAQKTQYCIVSIGQIREEVDGTGFFSPEKADFYKNFN